MTSADFLRLYLVADPGQCLGDLTASVEAALENGVTAVQLRAKSLNDRDHVALGKRLRSLTRVHRVPLLINDRVDIALATGADGVHLGVNDIAPADVRHLTPPGFIIGYSPDTAGDTAGEDADYLGIGPVYGTVSKLDAGSALGIDAFRHRVAAADLPVVGIGGITDSNARALIDAGAAGVAVISAILRQPDPGAAAHRLRQAIARSH